MSIAEYYYLLSKLPEDGRLFEETLFQWMKLGGLNINFTLRLDSLSALFSMIITGVGSLIHLYSIGYMHGEEGFYRFFSYLNLFCMSMLLLVLGNNMLVMFIGWEGVGLCSYLLIGYWYSDDNNAAAGANSKETRPPYSTRERRSRPRSSVPSKP